MVAETERVSGEGWISDDSSFYGDEDLKTRLEDISNTSTPTHHAFPTSLILAAATATSSSSTSRSKTTNHLHNPLDGQHDAWQLDEPHDAFLHRLRPSNSTIHDVGPWIWVANPHIPAKAERSDFEMMMEKCGKLLDDYTKFRMKTEKDMQGKAKGSITRKLTPKRALLPDAIAKVAVEAKCTSGKWMLFPPVEDVDVVWRTVVEGTVEGRFGPMAKVATQGDDRDARERLICVYTKDFSDKGDVRRVLNELVSAGLVRDDGAARSIWYKSDVYTHLGITSDNEFGIKASIYGSTKMLQEYE